MKLCDLLDLHFLLTYMLLPFGTDPMTPESSSIPSDTVSGEYVPMLAAVYSVISVSELVVLYNQVSASSVCAFVCDVYVYIAIWMIYS